MSVSAIRVSAKKQAKSAIIFLHGLGDSGEGWSWLPQVVEQTAILRNNDTINYVFPNAPQIPLTLNNGMLMPAWFDIFELRANSREDVKGFLNACSIVKELIKEQIEKHNIPAERIIIGGFSQGAAVSLAAAALVDIKIGGVVALSGFCPVTSTVTKQHTAKNFSTPVFQGHGDRDNVVSYTYGEQTSAFYKDLGFSNYTFKTYKGVAHTADDEELSDVMKFLDKILN